MELSRTRLPKKKLAKITAVFSRGPSQVRRLKFRAHKLAPLSRMPLQDQRQCMSKVTIEKTVRTYRLTHEALQGENTKRK
jgi:hypothetical protein